MRISIAAFAYALSIVAANYMTSHLGLVSVGFGLLVTAGTFAAGFALLARDFVHRYGGVRAALAAVVLGTLLSVVLADPRVAVASAVAFCAAELIDLAIYAPIRASHGFAWAALGSNIVSAPIDTAVFLHLAGFGVTAEAVGGQFIGKVIWATVIPLVIYLGVRRALLRKPVNSEGA